MILTVVSFLVLLGVVIAIHEFGHFAVAKLLGIRVLTFSLGFGPRLLGFNRGGTDYRISAFPLGGYVKMAGETYDEEREGAADEFLSHPRWHRFLVAIAGPVMNIALAVAVMTASYIEGVRVPRYQKEPAIVGPVVENSSARRAGVRSGDHVISVAGSPVHTWEDFDVALSTAPKDSLDLVLDRHGERLSMRLEPPTGPNPNVDAQSLGIKFMIPQTVVGGVVANTPAEKAGLHPGDEILSVRTPDGKVGRRYDEILNIISQSKGVSLDFEIRRGGAPPVPDGVVQPRIPETATTAQLLHVTITPEAGSDGNAVIGFFPEVPTDFEKYGLGRALAASVKRNLELSALVFKIIGRIFTGSASVKTLSGPLEIARISGGAAKTGSFRVFLGFIAMVSLQLGVFNLLPIPILDGGVIALLVVEAILGRDLSLALKEKIVQVGFVFLLLLMGFVVVNDISKIVNFDKLFR